MISLWATILTVALANAAIKAAGPILVGDRDLSPRANAVAAVLALSLLAALVVTETLGGKGRFAFGAGVVGCGVDGRGPGAPAAGCGARGRRLSRSCYRGSSGLIRLGTAKLA